MNLVQIKALFIKELANIYDVREIESIFEIVTEALLHYNRLEAGLKKNETIEDSRLQEFINIVNELKTKKPIQYIIGYAWFYGRSFKVNNNVLIPRPETEELVQWILQSVQQTDNIQIIDIGTGSGCIPITLQLALPHATISAIDISPESIQIAKENASIHHVAIQWVQMDITTTDVLPHQYDIIVSNPPYIPESEKASMHDNVLLHEPHIALFVPNETPLLFYEKIATLAAKHLNKEGFLFFEIHYDQAIAIQHMLESKGFKVTIRKDIYGQDRMIKAKKL